MRRPYSLPFVLSFTVVLLLTACSGSSGESADTTLAPTATEQATTTAAASTTTVATTTTVAAVTTTTEALPEEEASGSDEQWDLVFIGDSFGFGVAQAWSGLIEEAEGVEVRVHDHATGNLSLVQVREWLTDDSSDFADELRGEVAEAEIIFVSGNPVGVSPDEGCAPWPETYSEPPEPATPADWAPYGDVLRDVLDVVFGLRAGQPTVIRVAEPFASPIAGWREDGIEAVCTASWEAHAGVIREAADEYGVGTASWYDAFNGPDHNEDPVEKGYIGPDGWHQSLAGQKVEAEVLHALDYDPIIP